RLALALQRGGEVRFQPGARLGAEGLQIGAAEIRHGVPPDVVHGASSGRLAASMWPPSRRVNAVGERRTRRALTCFAPEFTAWWRARVVAERRSLRPGPPTALRCARRAVPLPPLGGGGRNGARLDRTVSDPWLSPAVAFRLHGRMKTVVCFGEVLLRLSPPGAETLLQSPRLEARIGGAEANVGVSLARFGHPVRMVSFLPGN